jgi:hypothetical protein
VSTVPSKPPTQPVPLKCISILLCEAAYPVGTTGNLIVVNTFHEVNSSVFPCRFPKITVLYTVTEGHGRYDLELSIVSASTGEATMRSRQQLMLENPLKIMDVQVTMLLVPLPAPGKYWVELRSAGELIGQRPFNVGRCPPLGGASPGA